MVFRLPLFLLSALFVFVWEQTHAAPLVVIDQQNSAVSATSFVGQNRIGQSFVPTLAGIDAIEFGIGTNNGGNTIFVNLREGLAGTGGLDGPIIGTSNPLIVPVDATFTTRHFDFPSRIALTPGNLYVAELVGTNGHAVQVSFGDQYAAGAALPQSSFDLGWDLRFAAGLHVPEPAAVLCGALGFMACVICVRPSRPNRARGR